MSDDWKDGRLSVQHDEYGGYDMMTCAWKVGRKWPHGFLSVFCIECGRNPTPEAEAEGERLALLFSAAPELSMALRGMLARYVELVKSGDAGHWNAETEPEVIAARAAIAKADGK